MGLRYAPELREWLADKVCLDHSNLWPARAFASRASAAVPPRKTPCMRPWDFGAPLRYAEDSSGPGFRFATLRTSKGARVGLSAGVLGSCELLCVSVAGPNAAHLRWTMQE